MKENQLTEGVIVDDQPYEDFLERIAPLGLHEPLLKTTIIDTYKAIHQWLENN